MAPLARTTGPLPWTAECLDGPCALGSLVADALCQWAASDHSAQPIVCLVPSRWLGAGLPGHRALEFESLSEVIPIHTLAFVRMEAGSLKSVLRQGQVAAWKSCPAAPSLAPSWQVSGLRFSWSACRDDGSDDVLEIVRPSGIVADHTELQVLTLEPAIPLLSSAGSVLESRQVALSAQRALADYLRATSPLNASALAVQSRMRVLPQASASGMEEGAADGGAGLAAAGTGSSSSNSPAALPCALSSACSAKVAQLRAAGRVTGMMEFDAISAHDAAYGLSSASLLLPICLIAGCLVTLLRRRRRMAAKHWRAAGLDETSSLADNMKAAGRGAGACAAAAAGREEESTARPSDESDRHGHGAAGAAGEHGSAGSGVLLPPFGASRGQQQLGTSERQPLRTGSQRLTSVNELGP